jgi:pectate lyase
MIFVLSYDSLKLVNSIMRLTFPLRYFVVLILFFPLVSNSFALPAFPGAEGFGTETPGGRGGRVIIVTTLASSGRGSLAEALAANGPRIIVFAVSGVINGPLPELQAENSFVTVAGQTSPGGITITGGGALLQSYQARFHDAVFRYLRFRGTSNYDSVQFNTVHHIIFDHCDFSGGADETFDITFSSDLTVQWSTITNSGPNGQRYGILLAYSPTTRISFHHNFMAHHVNRCGPHMHWGNRTTESPIIDYRNNVHYNCGFNHFLYIQSAGPHPLRFNFVGNYFKTGPAARELSFQAPITIPSASVYYEQDNYRVPENGVGRYDSIVDKTWAKPQEINQAHPVPPVTTSPIFENFDRVVAKVGAWPRDPMNDRTLQEMLNGTGSLGNVTDPFLTDNPSPPKDSDQDGMPNSWEVTKGLNPQDPTDNTTDRNNDGYTNIEEYINQRAAEVLGE